MPPKTRELVYCKCKSYCTQRNAQTGAYQGTGFLVSTSTRDNHMADDQRRLASAAAMQAAPHRSQGDNDRLSVVSAELDVLEKRPLTSRRKPLVFVNSPPAGDPFQPHLASHISSPNSGQYALNSSCHSNYPILSKEQRLSLLYVELDAMDGLEAPLPVKERILNMWETCVRERAYQWEQQSGGRSQNTPYMNTDDFSIHARSQNCIVRAASLITLVMQNMYFVPRRALRVLLGGLRDVLRQSGVSESATNAIPKDPQTAARLLDLDPSVRPYISCPKCHSLYPYQDDIHLPTHCTYQKTPSSPACASALWTQPRPGAQLKPIQKYYHQDMKSWLGRLLSRKEMEDHLDTYPLSEPTHEGASDDIWQSPVFQNLKAHDGTPFFPGPDNEGRVVFSLSVDGFNPFYNKAAKQIVSSTGIWMVLLNLPPHLRNLHENIYVPGVIPGPNKPSKEQIYPYIDLIVNDLLEFYLTGVYFSKTYKHALGRLFRAMLVPLVCDLLGARQLIGAASVTAHSFCSLCNLDIDDINVTDRRLWPQKNLSDIRLFAEHWRDAVNEEQQDNIFAASGVKWSPLLRLPYWDPIRYTIIDTMHTLDLNLLQNHVRLLFRIDLSHPGAILPPPTPRASATERTVSSDYMSQLLRCQRLIFENSGSMLEDLLLLPRSVLFDICVENNISTTDSGAVVGVKWVLVSFIIAWRRRPDFQDVAVPDFRVHRRGQKSSDAVASVSDSYILPREDGVSPTLVLRIVQLLAGDSNNSNSVTETRNDAYSQGSAKVFSYLNRLLDPSRLGNEESGQLVKKDQWNDLINMIDNDSNKLSILRSYCSQTEESLRPRALLGGDTMEEIWADMKRTKLPGWITPAPPNWGTVQRGKVTANQWRVIATIHLPITLIRLWHKIPEMAELLEHFMHLVAAVRIGHMRTSSPEQIAAYNYHIGTYVSKLTSLYPDEALKPTHHAAMHLGDVAEMFGPCHSHIAAVYERYINFFHRVNLNMKFGELEGTLLNMSARSANLKAILTDDEELRDAVESMVSVMAQIESEDLRGFRLSASLDPRLSGSISARSHPIPGILSNHEHQAYLSFCPSSQPSNHVILLREVSFRGVCYEVAGSLTHRFDNSCIIFRPAVDQGSDKAGIVQRIFHGCNQTSPSADNIYIVLLELVRCTDRVDPFSAYSIFGGFLCSGLAAHTTVVPLNQIVCHFAKTNLGGAFDGLTHVLPLDRLMYEGFDFSEDENINHD